MENPNFRLEGIIHEKDELQDFEGPLSLILMLLQKNKIEIRDLKISEILDQYLAWMAQMQSMDLEIASEFVQMASHLLYIKTRTLLTAEEEVSELEVLMESLEQLKAKDNLAAIREVVPELKKASELGMLFFPKLPEPLPESAREYPGGGRNPRHGHSPAHRLQRAQQEPGAAGAAAERPRHPGGTLSRLRHPLGGGGHLPERAGAVQRGQRPHRPGGDGLPALLHRRGRGRDPGKDRGIETYGYFCRT